MPPLQLSDGTLVAPRTHATSSCHLRKRCALQLPLGAPQPLARRSRPTAMPQVLEQALALRRRLSSSQPMEERAAWSTTMEQPLLAAAPVAPARQCGRARAAFPCAQRSRGLAPRQRHSAVVSGGKATLQHTDWGTRPLSPQALALQDLRRRAGVVPSRGGEDQPRPCVQQGAALQGAARRSSMRSRVVGLGHLGRLITPRLSTRLPWTTRSDWSLRRPSQLRRK